MGKKKKMTPAQAAAARRDDAKKKYSHPTAGELQKKASEARKFSPWLIIVPLIMILGVAAATMLPMFMSGMFG